MRPTSVRPPPVPHAPAAVSATSPPLTSLTGKAPHELQGIEAQAGAGAPGLESPAAPASPPSPPARETSVRESRARAARAGDSEALRRRLAEAVPEPAGASSPRRAEVEQTIARVMRDEAAEGPWTASDGLCLDLAAKWLPRLQAEGIPARLVTVDPARRSAGGPALERGEEGKFHAFLVVDEGARAPLIVDVSWRQFVSGAAERKDLPEVFVGTVQDAARLFAQHREALQVEIHDDPLLGKRDPRATAELVYGAGAHQGLRVVH